MSEKKRERRRRKDEYTGPGEQEVEKPSKDEYKVAKWMKKNVKTKKTKFLSHNVEYFSSNKAIDALMKSKFAQGDEPLFATREQAVELLDAMLEHKFFHRAKKVPVSLEELRGTGANAGAGTGAAAKTTKKPDTGTKTAEKSAASKKEKEKDKDKDKDKEKEKEEKKDTEGEAEASAGNGGGDENTNGGGADKKEKRKRKIRLDMHPEQVFVDGSEAYVWIYDPIPIHYWIYGLILLLGAILICLFPLWPPLLRKGVYYLSVAAAGFLCFILALTVVRLIIFTIVWALTGGKLHFWIFPNLTEDVGFFASFWPLYESKYVKDADKSKADKRTKSKSKKKDKDSDAEDDTATDALPPEPEKIEEVKEHDAEIELRRRNVVGVAGGGSKAETEEESHSSGGDNSEAAAESDAKCSRTPSESESEISGKDQFEIISSSEVQNFN